MKKLYGLLNLLVRAIWYGQLPQLRFVKIDWQSKIVIGGPNCCWDTIWLALRVSSQSETKFTAPIWKVI